MATIATDMVRELLNQADAEVNQAAGKGSDVTVIAGFKKISEIAMKLAGQLDVMKYELLKAQAGGARFQKFPLAKQRGIEKLPNFSGTRSDFGNWSRRVEVFLGDDMDLKKLLKDLRTVNLNDKVDKEDFTIDMGDGKVLDTDMVKDRGWTKDCFS